VPPGGALALNSQRSQWLADAVITRAG